MTERTIADVESDLAALQAEKDQLSLVGTKAIAAALQNGKAGTLAQDLTDLLPQVAVTSMAYQQAQYVITILNNALPAIQNDIKRIEDGARI